MYQWVKVPCTMQLAYLHHKHFGVRVGTENELARRSALYRDDGDRSGNALH